jgi:hypothetical protein
LPLSCSGGHSEPDQQMLHGRCRISTVYGGSSQALPISDMRFYNRIVAFVGQVMPPQSRTGSSSTSSSGDPGRESVRPARKVIRSRELHPLRPPANAVRSLEGEATLGCCLSRQVIRTNQRRLEILSVRGSHRFAASPPLEPAQPLCNYRVCMSSTNSERVLMSIRRPEDGPGYSKN